MIEEGVYLDLCNEAYHGDKNSLSRSSIMDFGKSPHYFWSKHLNKNRPQKKSTAAMMFGAAFHTYVLEFDKFNEFYEIELPKVLLKDVGREKYDQNKKALQEQMNCGKKIISKDDVDLLREMKSALNSCKTAFDLIRGATYEKSFFWTDEHSGLMIKSRPDILHDNMIIDLKTMNDVSPRSFQSWMVSSGYHVQGAMIRDAVKHFEGKDISTVINICIEKEYPYSIAIYIIDEAALEAGHMQYKQLLLEIKDACENNDFPDGGVQIIGLPAWAHY